MTNISDLEGSEASLRRSMRINIILPRSGLTGGIKANRLIAEAMVRRGHDVRLIYVASPVPRPSPFRVRTYLRRLWDDIKTIRNRSHHLEESTARLIPVYNDPIRSIDAPDADITIATWWETAEWIEKWPKEKGMKAYFVRGHELFGGDPERVKKTYYFPYQKIVISSWLKRVMAEEYADDNTILAPDGIDRSHFDSTPRSKAPIPTVGMIYSERKLKGSKTAFEAIRQVQRSLPRLRVVAFGMSPIKKERYIPDHLEFHLAPAQWKIPYLYRSTDCWILSSTTEGFGMPGLEAAACRCPVVSTRCGGPADYIDDGASGYLVDVGDSDEMARRLLEIVSLDEDQWRKMSEASYRKSLGFSWDRSAAVLEKGLWAALERTSSLPAPA